jgi:pimeloyl-ACP methyl ester carboxylesterase
MKIFSLVIILIILFTICCISIHHLNLYTEKKKLVPSGDIVEVHGHKMHIYSEGRFQNNFPSLVFMSGGGTAAPVYDFKPLYSLLSDYHIIVVEKLGYGYSDIMDEARDIDTMLNETREALKYAGKNEPYILIPHSMSGLEALYWAQKYPDEIRAIIGIDMAMPEAYNYYKVNSMQYKFLRIGAIIGLQRIPFIYPISTKGLTLEEQNQTKYLTYRNAVNKVFINEIEYVYKNAEKVKESDYPKIPMLLFSSDGAEIGNFWVKCQEDFANTMNARLIQLNGGHYIHQFEPEKIAEECKIFLKILE